MPELLRVATAGSVDDGKSTLLGRLLCDNEAVADDQLESVRQASGAATGGLDFAYITDGLRAEREQGITIDVAYRHFRTMRRRFILADSPGHEQYTRNMATAASTADLVLLLMDARKGPLEQSHRHAAIAALLGVRRIVVAVNKMDLVEYDAGVFDEILRQFAPILDGLGFPAPCFIPLSALRGDNVSSTSGRMQWYSGPTLLDYLDTVDPGPAVSDGVGLRFPVQCVLRDDSGRRSCAGRIIAGRVHAGSRVRILPSGRETTVVAVREGARELGEAVAPAAVALELADPVDLGRGDLICGCGELPVISGSPRRWPDGTTGDAGGSGKSDQLSVISCQLSDRRDPPVGSGPSDYTLRSVDPLVGGGVDQPLPGLRAVQTGLGPVDASIKDGGACGRLVGSPAEPLPAGLGPSDCLPGAVAQRAALDSVSIPDQAPLVSRSVHATLIWLADEPLDRSASYLLKHTTRLTAARITRVRHRLGLPALAPVRGEEIRLNEIAEVELETQQSLCFDPYDSNRETGSIILIDRATNQTVAAGMLRDAVAVPSAPAAAGLTVWFTGLSGAGKSTLSEAVGAELSARGCRTESLDGDVVRRHLSRGLGFSREDRDENIRRIGFVAGLLTRHGVVTLVSAISPYRAVRDEVRASIGSFLEVFVNAPLEVCERRDPKGLYARARRGELPGFTGIDDPYEAPEQPNVECRTDRESLAESCARVVEVIEQRVSAAGR